MQVRLTRQAQRDLLDIWLAIAADSPMAADRLYETLDRRIGTTRFPQAGTARPDIGHEARVLVEWPYLILYREIAEGVQIARVLHGARDIDAQSFETGFD